MLASYRSHAQTAAPNMKPRRLPSRTPCAGFTRTDLATGTAAFACLAALVLPALGGHPGQGRAALCAANLARLQKAWLEFANDNGDVLPRASGSPINWVSGWIDFGPTPDATNVLNLLDPRFAQLGPYTRDAALYRCPSDTSTARFRNPDQTWAAPIPRVRSYSLNGISNGDGSFVSSPYAPYRRLTDVVNPPPSATFTFIDEHPGSINDGYFAVALPANGRIIDFPASHHERAGTVAFVDGHVEVHPWKDRRTRPPVRGFSMPLNIPSPGNPDVQWLTDHAGGRR